MEESFVLRDTVLLFDRYSWDSQRLHKSFLQADSECSVIVLEEDNFLPEGVMSIYDMFLGYYEDKGKKPGKPRFFNEVPVPEHWSISAGIGETEYGKITWQHEEKGRIYYQEDLNKLFMECDYYFDINHWSEMVSAVYRAFLHNQLILAFEETAHNREFVADAHVYPAAAFDRMVSDVRQMMEDVGLMKHHLEMQHDDAMVEEKDVYIRLME